MYTRDSNAFADDAVYSKTNRLPVIPETDGDAEMNCERLRTAFESREAIYVEKRAVGVRVTNIRYNVAARHIAAGYLAAFSEHTWKMGYGGWSLFFAPELVSGLAGCAADWPSDLDAGERYSRALQFLTDHQGLEPVVRVFPD